MSGPQGDPGKVAVRHLRLPASIPAGASARAALTAVIAYDKGIPRFAK